MINELNVDEKLKQREAELDLISRVQKGLLEKKDIQEIYELIGEWLRDLFKSQVTGISTFDHDTDQEHFQYLFEDGERLYPESRPLNKIRKWIIQHADTLLVNKNANQKIEEVTGAVHEPVPGTRLPKSLVFVPLNVDKVVTGCLSLQNLDRENAFQDSDVQLLMTLANSISIALENARLFNETEQRNAELAVINSVQEGLVAEMTLQGIYDLVGDKIRDLFDAQVVGIATFDHENKIEHFQYLYENGERYYPTARPFDKVRQRLIKTQRMIWINEKAEEAFRTITGEDPKAIPGTGFPKSMVYVPLLIGDSVRGYVTLQNLDREQAFSDSDVRLLSTLANSMSVALENARLFTETEQRNAELAVINSVQEGLVAEMDLQGIYDLVGDRIRDLFDAQVAIICTFDHNSEKEYFQYNFEDGERIFPEPRPLDNFRRRLIKTKKLILINENFPERAKEILGIKPKAVPGTILPKSVLFVPMVIGDLTRGYVSLQNLDREHAFPESDVRLLSTLANSMSVALENARLFNETTRLLAETEQRATELQTVSNISSAMISQLEFDALIKMVGDQMKVTFKADIVYIALYDRDSNTIFFPYEYGDKNEPRTFGDGFTERIITSNEPLLINKDLAEIRTQLKAKQIGRITSSFLGVPIQTGDVPNGVISVQSTEEENRFDENDMRLLSTIAANVSVSMQNAEAYRKLRSALDELKSAQEQLIQQEKLASLGQLTAGIAHEIKNPLNFVTNFSDVSIELIDEAMEDILRLRKKFTGNSAIDKTEIEEILGDYENILNDVKTNLSKIHEHGSRADSIVKSMLQHSRGGTGKMEPTDVNAVVKEYVNLSFHGMRAGKEPINVDIELNLDDSVGKVPLISEDFSRVMVNLCHNAFDAMRDKLTWDGGRKTGASYNPKLTVRTKSNGKTIILEIEDNGPGIPEKLKDKILQPFFTTKKGTEGTGLGLSITNDIIKAHGGSLDIKTEDGKGSTFIISLPNI